MKKSLLLLSILFLPLFSVFAQEQPFYYYHGRKIALKASTSEVYVKFREGISASRKLDALRGMRQLTLAKDQSPLLRTLRYELAPSERSEDGMKRILATLRARPDIEAAFPAYITEFGDTVYVTNEVIYMPKIKGDPRLQSMHNDNAATVMETFSMGPDKEQVLVKLADGVDPLVAAKRMVESGLVEFAQPNFMTICHVHQSAERLTPSSAPVSDPDEEHARQILKAIQAAKNPMRAALPIGPIRLYLTPNDPSFVNQWFLQNTGQNIGNQIGVIGADISATEAWDITTGSTSIVVSVWDSGYDLDHPEFAGKIVSSYNAAGTNGTDGVGGPAVPTDPGAANENHGTPCAGLIAALTNNNASVASVGYNVRVHLVRIGFNFTATGSFSTTDAVIARAATNTLGVSGVVAVSQSWGGGSANASWEASFNSVRTGARGGLGAVMLFSAGNAGTGIVGYPARAANIIAVGATDNSDRRAGFSQFGDALDVVAPGVNTLTLDRQGTAGYTSGNETFFSGTSAACPIAAGVVGLAASANPSLSGGQLEEILQRTCDKVGNYAYGTATGQTPWTMD
jgi:methylmalonyl-CoA mutase cobalamin-binding subunit